MLGGVITRQREGTGLSAAKEPSQTGPCDLDASLAGRAHSGNYVNFTLEKPTVRRRPEATTQTRISARERRASAAGRAESRPVLASGTRLTCTRQGELLGSRPASQTSQLALANSGSQMTFSHTVMRLFPGRGQHINRYPCLRAVWMEIPHPQPRKAPQPRCYSGMVPRSASTPHQMRRHCQPGLHPAALDGSAGPQDIFNLRTLKWVMGPS